MQAIKMSLPLFIPVQIEELKNIELNPYYFTAVDSTPGTAIFGEVYLFEDKIIDVYSLVFPFTAGQLQQLKELNFLVLKDSTYKDSAAEEAHLKRLYDTYGVPVICQRAYIHTSVFRKAFTFLAVSELSVKTLSQISKITTLTKKFPEPKKVASKLGIGLFKDGKLLSLHIHPTAASVPMALPVLNQFLESGNAWFGEVEVQPSHPLSASSTDIIEKPIFVYYTTLFFYMARSIPNLPEHTIKLIQGVCGMHFNRLRPYVNPYTQVSGTTT